ncbi:hypothetical protein L287_24150 (plasmid) [Salmonella enterica subsp. enterica serovar Infantis str. 119944]|uniref:hypothetical protein n=1 Tax=Salmonella enterica TaxID=28901 RepID=UPI0003D3C3A8|nr:hypothetical protein [Salmonella enterica]ETE47328.1 hypothetical protein L287_24150 [Salmonella enterica subsp. enterica serovar Infantis str. 119944]
MVIRKGQWLFSAMNRLPMLSCGEPDTDVEAGMNLLAGVLPLRHASVWGALPRNGAFYQAAQIRGAERYRKDG